MTIRPADASRGHPADPRTRRPTTGAPDDPVRRRPEATPAAGGRLRHLRGRWGRVLLVRAAPHLTVAGQWFLPGGGLDHGEDPVAGLRREFHEETGLDIKPGPLLGILSDVFTLPDAAEPASTPSGSSTAWTAIQGSCGTRWAARRTSPAGCRSTRHWTCPCDPTSDEALTELRP